MSIINHADVGGRYSILTEVGLLPAAISGLNVEQICRGAESLLDTLDPDNLDACLPAMGAATQYALMQHGMFGTILMPYTDHLNDFAMWWMQIWAESLGKNGQGNTPIHALGTIDQHSQLQLYLDGPDDKCYTIIRSQSEGKQCDAINADYFSSDQFAYLPGKNLSDIMSISAEATIQTLVNHNRPVRVMEVGEVCEETIGALAMHMMLETIITAYVMGVNPYDQPVVEEGKIIARELLGAV